MGTEFSLNLNPKERESALLDEPSYELQKIIPKIIPNNINIYVKKI